METQHITPEAHHFRQRWHLTQNPFLVSSAENLEDAEILRLFVADPQSSLAAFSFNVNNIIRGIYGSGKTMCLRAVEAFAFSQVIVDLIETGHTPVIPVRVNLSEIGHISDSDEIYRAIVLRVFRSIISIGHTIQRYVSSDTWFPTFRDWRDKLTRSGIYAQDDRYARLSATTVSTQARASFKAGGKFPGAEFIKVVAERGQESTITTSPKPSIVDISDFHEKSLSRYCDRLLLLFDEVGSLQPGFFVTKGNAPSAYETLMNQLRTNGNVYYKVCVYPGHYSDTLQESRYGTRINLDYSMTDRRALGTYVNLCRNIMSRYIRAVQDDGDQRRLQDFLDDGDVTDAIDSPHNCGKGNGSALEQLCYASGGVLRRLFTLTSKAMLMASRDEAGSPFVGRTLVFKCLGAFGAELVNRHSMSERNQVASIADACRRADTYRFRSEIDPQSLLKPFLSKTQQDSILSVAEHARGPSGTVYEFDYGYCIANDLPTHRHRGSRNPCRARTGGHAEWIDDVADLTDEVLRLSGLTRGLIARFFPDKGFGFIWFDPQQEDVFFHVEDVIDFGSLSAQSDLRKVRVRFALGDTPRGKKARSIVVES